MPQTIRVLTFKTNPLPAFLLSRLIQSHAVLFENPMNPIMRNVPTVFIQHNLNANRTHSRMHFTNPKHSSHITRSYRHLFLATLQQPRTFLILIALKHTPRMARRNTLLFSYSTHALNPEPHFLHNPPNFTLVQFLHNF